MRTILTLAGMRIRITLRNKAFLFFSLSCLLGIFFAVRQHAGEGQSYEAVSYLDGSDSFVHGDGDVLGTEHAIGDLAGAGDSAPIPTCANCSVQHDCFEYLANYALIMPTVFLQLGCSPVLCITSTLSET